MAKYIKNPFIFALIFTGIIFCLLSKHIPTSIIGTKNAEAGLSSLRVMMGSSLFEGDGVSYNFDGAGSPHDHLNIGDHADFAFAGDFTIEMWTRHGAFPGSDQFLVSQYESGSTRLELYLTAGGNLQIIFQSGGSNLFVSAPSHGFATDIWHHLAITRDGNDFTAYVDGSSIATSTSAVAYPNIAGDFEFGVQSNGDGNGHSGFMDEMRVSTLSRYSGEFTPPRNEFVSDANTVLLIHCGETKTGTTGSGATFTDSGNTGHLVTETGNAIEETTEVKF